MKLRTLFSLIVLLAALPALSATRVFVSGNGTDAGACAVTAPCRSFAYAFTQVSAAGEIIALDTAGYGPVNITQSVTIVAAPGATAFVAASSGTAIAINAGVSDVVTLRGLSLSSTGASFGVDFATGGRADIENSVINGFGIGIRFYRTGDFSKPALHAINTVVRNNTIGLSAADLGAGVTGPPNNICYAVIAGSLFVGNTYAGVDAADNARVAVSDSVFASNQTAVMADAGHELSFSELNLDRCNIFRNGTAIEAGDAAAATSNRGVVRVANCMITGNDTGVVTTPNGSTSSRISNGTYTNTLEGNGTDGAFTDSYTAK